MSSSSSIACSSETSPKDAFIESLDLTVMEQLALETRRTHLTTHGVSGEQPTTLSDLKCSVVSPPMSGSYNIVYELRFSDATSWVIRIPVDEWGPADARSMQLDIVAMEYITARTSVPIPALHAYSCDTNNPLQHPYMIMDMIKGTLLIDIWYDSSWWSGTRSKEHLLHSLAAHMVELAGLEFDKIGRLDRVQPDGPYFIAPFPEVADIFGDGKGPGGELGPFSSVHEYFMALLEARRARNGNNSMFALLQMFIGALVDPRYDTAPFHLGHPDLEIQNIIVDNETGKVAALIDWDGVGVGGRQIHALSYPLWLTVDWDPTMYEPQKRLPECDSEEDLRRYRQKYEDAIGAASGGTLASVTRNSHIPVCLEMAITSELITAGMVFHLGKYVFGSSILALDVLEGIEHSGWYTRTSPDDVAEIKLLGKFKPDGPVPE
ncbi:hypothetical protein TRAPUB_2599 [Trametes pubescens]|uniref:Aminoglycoside phosphotransferase domain-containing protein n=1 Tax=Trametes pubescens TaxID=154538 RepID=A0A1M2VFY9_TRAPU|nr:hypothetical protein TRAPUB_2599 [Trametes pubescens]